MKITNNMWEGPSTVGISKMVILTLNFFSWVFFKVHSKTWFSILCHKVEFRKRQVHLRHILREHPKKNSKSHSMYTDRSLLHPFQWTLKILHFSILKGVFPELALYDCLVCTLCKGNWLRKWVTAEIQTRLLLYSYMPEDLGLRKGYIFLIL